METVAPRPRTDLPMRCVVERKLATVLFVDLVDSTELVADADPEIVRRRVGRFFDQVSHCIVTHGGIGREVRRRRGDGRVRRPARARGRRRARRPRGARDPRARQGARRSRARIGIESGEVVAEDSRVDVRHRRGRQPRRPPAAVGRGATRSSSAPPRRGSSAAASSSSRLPPLELRGWRGAGRGEPRRLPRRARRRAARRARGAARRSRAELDLLENDVRTAPPATGARPSSPSTASRASARAGSSREFVDGLEGATVLKGRCLPYGEGVTYWPLAEMVKASAGISDDDPLDEAYEKLRDCCEDEAVADLLGLAVGVLEAVEAERAQQEIAWAVRALGGAARRGAAARARLRGRPLGRGAAARPRRAPRRLGARSAVAAALPRAAGAARRPPDVGRRPHPRADARARVAAARREQGARRRC